MKVTLWKQHKGYFQPYNIVPNISTAHRAGSIPLQQSCPSTPLRTALSDPWVFSETKFLLFPSNTILGLGFLNSSLQGSMMGVNWVCQWSNKNNFLNEVWPTRLSRTMIYLEKDPVVLLVTVFMVLVLILITHNWCIVTLRYLPTFSKLSKSLFSQTSTWATVFCFLCVFVCLFFYYYMQGFSLSSVTLKLGESQMAFLYLLNNQPSLRLKKNCFRKKSIKSKHFMSWVVFAEEFNYEAGSHNRAFPIEKSLLWSSLFSSPPALESMPWLPSCPDFVIPAHLPLLHHSSSNHMSPSSIIEITQCTPNSNQQICYFNIHVGK